MTGSKSIYSHSPSIVTRKTGSEYVLVPIADNIADMDSVYTLNETGALVWELIDGKRTVQEIIEALMNEYEIDYQTAENDILTLIERLDKYLIITSLPPAQPPGREEEV